MTCSKSVAILPIMRFGSHLMRTAKVGIALQIQGLTVPISGLSHFATGSDNRDDERTALNELVPTEA